MLATALTDSLDVFLNATRNTIITDGTNENLTFDPNGIGNIIAGLETNSAWLAGEETAVGSVADAVSVGTTTISKVAHGLTAHNGDLLHLIDSTTAADEGFYRIVSWTDSTFVVDRALSGSEIDIDFTIYTDVLGVFATDGTNGMRIMAYANDKPLQIGGEDYVATTRNLGGEDIIFRGSVEFDKPIHFEGNTYFRSTILVLDDVNFRIGTGNAITFKWDTNAANDDVGLVTFLESDGTDIPGLIISDASWDPDGDATFDDITEPFLGFKDDDADSDMRIGFITDDSPGIVTDGDTFTLGGTSDTDVFTFNADGSLLARKQITVGDDALDLNGRVDFIDADGNSISFIGGNDRIILESSTGKSELHIDYITGAIAAGTEHSVIHINIEDETATGGLVHGIDIADVGTGTVTVVGMGIFPGVKPIFQHTGTFVTPDKALKFYKLGAPTDTTDVTTAFGSTSADSTLFNHDDDEVLLGAAAVFNEIEVILNTAAANPGIKPTFWYSSGGDGSWTQFFPEDGSNGMRDSGIIDWVSGDLSWTTWNLDGTDQYWIRIIRTQGNLSTIPIEDTFKILASTDYTWDENGSLNINSLTTNGGMIYAGLSHVGSSRNTTAADYYIDVSSDDAAITITLDTDNVVAGFTLHFKDVDGNAFTNNITIDTEASEKIDGEDTFVVSTNYAAWGVKSDGINWFIF